MSISIFRLQRKKKTDKLDDVIIQIDILEDHLNQRFILFAQVFRPQLQFIR